MTNGKRVKTQAAVEKTVQTADGAPEKYFVVDTSALE